MTTIILCSQPECQTTAGCKCTNVVTLDGRGRYRNPRTDLQSTLPNLWNAIVEHTKAPEAFWLGEILLNEITKETGYTGQPR